MEFGRPDHFSDDDFEESIGVREIFEKYVIYLNGLLSAFCYSDC